MKIPLARELDASADEVWAVLGEGFGDLSWSSAVTSSSIEGELGAGTVRTCRFPPNMFSKDGFVRETLLSFDREQMSLSYEADLPGFMPHATNRWTITPIADGRCTITSAATVQLRGAIVLLRPLLGFVLRRLGHKFVDDLMAQVEVRRQRSQEAA